MMRAQPRTNFHSSALLRCLTDLAVVPAAEPETAFAEKLGLWIHFTDAIKLSAIHGEGAIGVAASKGTGQPGAGRKEDARGALGLAFDRVEAALAESIVKSCSINPGRAHITLPRPVFTLPLDLAVAYEPYRRFYDAHQHDMTLNVQPLRVNVREALAKASPALRKLADLDAALETILRERERKLLAKVPVLLKTRFAQLYQAHQQDLVTTGQSDNPFAWMQPDAWLARFCKDLQMLLLAEFELRLQPALGLIEAFDHNIQHD